MAAGGSAGGRVCFGVLTGLDGSATGVSLILAAVDQSSLDGDGGSDPRTDLAFEILGLAGCASIGAAGIDDFDFPSLEGDGVS